MIEVISSLSPIISALIGVISYATLTNYRLDKLDSQVEKIETLEHRVTVLETTVKQLNK